jgi:hypothetical protein
MDKQRERERKLSLERIEKKINRATTAIGKKS